MPKKTPKPQNPKTPKPQNPISTINMLRGLILLLSIFIHTLAAPVDFDCDSIRTDTNEPALLRKIKQAVNKEMWFGKECLKYAC